MASSIEDRGWDQRILTTLVLGPSIESSISHLN